MNYNSERENPYSVVLLINCNFIWYGVPYSHRIEDFLSSNRVCNYNFNLQAQKYTDGAFRSNETQYPVGARNEPKLSQWQNEKITYPIKKENRDTSRMGRPGPVEKKLSPRSRSRSPVKDRFRRHSPSPRSPRRSWALEKRRSPEVVREPPPPPLWPGQNSEDKSKHPVWQRSENDEERSFDDKRERNEDKYKPRYSPRRDDEVIRDYRDEPKFERDFRPEDRPDYRRPSPHRDEKKLFNEVDKDFNDIYQRAVEFRRKTEELRKSNDRRNRSYDEENSPLREIAPPIVRSEKSKPSWIPIKLQTKEIERNTRWRLEPSVKDKRDKATDEIANRILEPHNFTAEQKHRVLEELKLSVYNIMMEMFKDKDVSYIELVIKFRARYDAKDEEKILQDVLTSMPSHYRNMLKRKSEGKSHFLFVYNSSYSFFLLEQLLLSHFNTFVFNNTYQYVNHVLRIAKASFQCRKILVSFQINVLHNFPPIKNIVQTRLYIVIQLQIVFR